MQRSAVTRCLLIKSYFDAGNNWCLKLLHDLRHESVATLGSISYFGDTCRKLVLEP